MKFSVINKGVAAATSEWIVAELEVNLNKYKPDMVTAMMGINDNVLFCLDKNISRNNPFFQSCRVYTLARFIQLSLASEIKRGVFHNKKENSSGDTLFAGCSTVRVDEAGARVLESSADLDAELLKKEAQRNPKDDRIFARLGLVYNVQGNLPEAERMLRKAITLNPSNDFAYMELGWIYKKWGKLSEAEELHRKAIELNPKNSTSYNYRKLKEILDKRRIKLVCIQYPMRSIKPLKEIFDSTSGIIFVDNERVFKKAIAQAQYNEYFKDSFAGDFGHLTPRGNSLLAENIANVILKEVFHK